MKRQYEGGAVSMTHRWGRPPLSCRPCRQKKRRCDRHQPCSNCSQRNIHCEYSERNQSDAGQDDRILPVTTTNSSSQSGAISSAEQEPGKDRHCDEILRRIDRLEEAVFDKLCHESREFDGSGGGGGGVQATEPPFFTRFALHPTSASESRIALDAARLANHLPPIAEARKLFDHFAKTTQPILGILHMPSTRDLIEQTYKALLLDEVAPSVTELLLLFSIFGCSALTWNPEFLDALNATRLQARLASLAYMRLALSILDDSKPIPASTNALAAMQILAHLITHEDGYPVKVHLIRTQSLWMARGMQIHCLDSSKSRQERSLRGCNLIEVEVQRRIWWHMVATDWLSSFSGGALDGAYIFQPKQMNVNYPTNTDDEFITATEILQETPLQSKPTSMTGFIYRIKLAELCRRVVDAIPSPLLDFDKPDYSTILGLDRDFHTYLKGLPVFLQRDAQSIEQSKTLYSEYPHLPWKRITAHLSIHTRLCQLHRHYHLEGMTNPQYAYSHEVSIRSAQTVLELIRSLDEACAQVGLKATRSWMTTNHVFRAALVLATDVSFNSNAPGAEARRAKVLGAYQVLESSMEEPSGLREGIQRNLQTLLATLHRRQSNTVEGGRVTAGSRVSNVIVDDAGGGNAREGGEYSGVSGFEIGEANWDQLWSEFVAVAPDLDSPQWNSLLDGVDFNWM